MTRTKRILLVSGVALAGLAVMFVLALVGLVLNAFGPPLRVARDGKAIVVHVETLGEYPTTIRHLRIEEADSRKVVFEAVVKPEFENKSGGQFWRFSLVPGTNPVYLWDSADDAYTITVPNGGKSFLLRPGVAYRVTAWNTSPFKSGATFTF